MHKFFEVVTVILASGGAGVLWLFVHVARPMARKQRQRQGMMVFFMDGVLGIG
jgi:hypothetical protein